MRKKAEKEVGEEAEKETEKKGKKKKGCLRGLIVLAVIAALITVIVIIVMNSGNTSVRKGDFWYSKESDGTYSVLLADSYEGTVVDFPSEYKKKPVSSVGATSDKITGVIIPEGVTTIHFADCTALTAVKIPSSVTQISQEAFKNCTALESIELPSTVTKIGNSAFEGCTALAKVKLPGNDVDIGWMAFKGCTALEEVEMPVVSTIGRNAFEGCTKLTTVVTCVRSIESEAFEGCTALNSVTLLEEGDHTLKDAGSYVFEGCDKLTSIRYSGTTEKWRSVAGNVFGHLNGDESKAKRVYCSDGTEKYW